MNQQHNKGRLSLIIPIIFVFDSFSYILNRNSPDLYRQDSIEVLSSWTLFFQKLFQNQACSLYWAYNNKIMQTCSEQTQKIKGVRVQAHSQYAKSRTACQSICDEGKSIKLIVNARHRPVDENDELAEQTYMKRKKVNLGKVLFSDNNFHATVPKIVQSHCSYLQQLRNLPRRIYQPSNIKVLLKTEYSVIHNLIHKYFNFKFYTKEDQHSDIFLIWIDSYVSEEFVKRLKCYQRINHFPSSNELGRKDLLAINLNMAKSYMPELYQFYPKTWVLPKDFQAFSQRETSSFYIVKPHANCQGRGIYLTKNPSLTPKDEVIVQQYIQNPLLIEGCKFDLRVYVMLRSLDPLRIYVYQEGLCRLATSKYSKPNQNNFKNDKMHLTNYAINKFAPNFVGNSDIRQDFKGHKRSLTAAMKSLSEMGFDTTKILERIDSIIIRSILAAYTKMLQSYKKTRENSENFKYIKEFINIKEQIRTNNSESTQQSVCFELFGFDIMILQTGQPILLQINHQPSLVTDSPLDLSTKRCLIMDTINILNIEQSSKNLCQKNHSDPVPYKPKNVQEKQLEHKGGYRRVYPLSHIKLHEKTEEQASHIQKHIETYETMINRIMFREFKRLSKLKMINYKTINSRHNRTHISKYSHEDGDASISAPKTSETKHNKYHNQKSIALTFYNLFNNSKYYISSSKKKEQGRESQAQLQQTVIKNHVLLQSIERPNKVKNTANSFQLTDKRRNNDLIDLKMKSRRQEFYMRKNEAFSCKRPQFFVDKDINNVQDSSIGQNERISKLARFNLISSKNKGTIHYISTNKSKKQLQQRKRTTENENFIPTFSAVGNRHIDTAQVSQRRHNQQQKEQCNPQAERIKTSEKNRSHQNDYSRQYKQIYSHSIKEKMEKINNLKIIKNNLHKLNFINFVERTKGVRHVIGSLENENQQGSQSTMK